MPVLPGEQGRPQGLGQCGRPQAGPAACQEPVSQCSRQCREGQVRRVKGFHSCCYDCVDCKAGSYQRHPGEALGGQPTLRPVRPGTATGSGLGQRQGRKPVAPSRPLSSLASDDALCSKCDQDQWSPDGSTRCFPRTPRFLAWGGQPMLGCSCCWASFWVWCCWPWDSSPGTPGQPTSSGHRGAQGLPAWPAWAWSASASFYSLAGPALPTAWASSCCSTSAYWLPEHTIPAGS